MLCCWSYITLHHLQLVHHRPLAGIRKILLQNSGIFLHLHAVHAPPHTVQVGCILVSGTHCRQYRNRLCHILPLSLLDFVKTAQGLRITITNTTERIKLHKQNIYDNLAVLAWSIKKQNSWQNEKELYHHIYITSPPSLCNILSTLI